MTINHKLEPKVPSDYTPNAKGLLDSVILVTGASRGIGKAMAIALAKHGAKVILLSRDIKALEATYDEIVNNGYPEPAIYPLNLASATYDHYVDMAKTISSEYGRLDGILHNAGELGGLAPIEHFMPNTWYEVMQVNLNSAFLLTQTHLELLKSSKHSPTIVFTSSGVARKPKAFWGAYSVSKAGIDNMAAMMQEELEHKNFRIYSVNPGPIKTKMREAAFPAEDSNSLAPPESLTNKYLYMFEKQHEVSK